MKKILSLIILVLLCTLSFVNAKEYKNLPSMVKAGDKYTSEDSKWNNNIYTITVYLDDTEITPTVNEMKKTFTFTKDAYYYESEPREQTQVDGINYYNTKIKYKSIKENDRFVSAEDIKNGNIVYSGDILYTNEEYNSEHYLRFPMLYMYFYDKEDNIIDEFNVYGRLTSIIPKFEGKDTIWRAEVYDPGYEDIGLYFIPIEYEKPTFSLTCKDEKINYGDETECTLKVKSLENLEYVNFGMFSEDLEILDISYPQGVKEVAGETKEYNLTIDNGYAKDNNEVPLMLFKVKGKKDNTYFDSIKVTDIEYKDGKVLGKYIDISGRIDILSVKSDTQKNPETGNDLMLISVPIALLAFGIIMTSVFKQKKIEG